MSVQQRVPPEPPYRPEGCTCPYEVKNLGILYGISLGRGWVRMTDDPACPVHGEGGGPVPRLEGDNIVKSWRYKGP